EELAVGRRDLNPRVRRLVLATADLYVLNDELAAAVHDFVHDPWQGIGIDDVSVELDNLRESHLGVPGSLSSDGRGDCGCGRRAAGAALRGGAARVRALRHYAGRCFSGARSLF